MLLTALSTALFSQVHRGSAWWGQSQR